MNTSSRPDPNTARDRSAASQAEPSGANRLDQTAGSVRWEGGTFHRFAQSVRGMAGSPRATALLLAGLLGWVGFGPLVHFSRAWELTATAGAPIAALMLLLVIQHTQNRNDRATQLKLNELIRASGSATDRLIGIEDSSAPDLLRLHHEYRHHVETTHRRATVSRARWKHAPPWSRRHSAGHPAGGQWKVVQHSAGGAAAGDWQLVYSRHGTQQAAQRSARNLRRRAASTLRADERTWDCSVVLEHEPQRRG